MAEDWDLEAVVRGCKSATKTTTSTTSSTAITAAINSNTAALEAEMSLWDWLKAEVENDPFSFPNLVEPRDNAFQELQQFYKPFYLNPTINNNTTTSYGIIPNPPIISDFGGSSGQRHHQQQQLHHFLPTNTTIRPHFNPATIPVSSFGGFHEQQQQAQQQMLQQNQIQPQQQQPQNHQQGFAAPIPPTMQIQPPRSRKRKSQQKRLVCQVRAENLSGDLWAWRKYGQKPIKGSPHPRNYYRCSSTKGCAARKQVERSTTDPDIFIVTYTGDHTHPRPTHRNSLAGSTRAKLSSAAATSSHNKPSNKDFNSGSPNAAASPLSASSSLSTPPLQADKDGADQEVDDEEMDNDEDENEDEDGLLIPNNMVTSDDIFMGLQQLETNTFRGTTGTSQMATVASGGNFSNKGQPNLGSSWAGTHSSSAGATVGGGF